MGALDTTMPALSEAAGGFAPTEDLFDPPAGLLAEGVRIRADAYAQGSALRTGRRMRSHTAIADALDKPAGTVATVGTEGTRIKSAFLKLLDLLDRDRRLWGADSGPDLEEDAEPVLVFHRRVARKAKPGLSAVPLAHQLRLRVRGRLVGVVPPALALKITPAIAVTRPLIRALFLEALQRRPRLNQRRIHREVLIANPTLGLREPHDLSKEQVRHLVLQQPRLVLGERGVVEDRLVGVKVQEPAEQQIILEALAELPLRTDRVERHQHLCQKQPLWRDRRPSALCIHLLEVLVHLSKDDTKDTLDRTDGMIHWDHRLHVKKARHTHLAVLFSSHPPTSAIAAPESSFSNNRLSGSAIFLPKEPVPH
jgi:hypothetical protein